MHFFIYPPSWPFTLVSALPAGSADEEGWLPASTPVHLCAPLGQIREMGAGPSHTPWAAAEERSSPTLAGRVLKSWPKDWSRPLCTFT